MKYLGLAIAVLSTLLSTPATASAQDTTGVGVVSGRVVTIGGAVAPNVAVCVPALSRCVATDPSGRFSISDRRAGAYAIEILAPSMPPLTARVDSSANPRAMSVGSRGASHGR